MVVINGDTGIDKVQDASIVDADLNLSVKPMFKAYQTGSQTVTTNNIALVQVNTEVYDTTNAYSTGSYVFVPTKPGYYQVNGTIAGAGSTGTNLVEVSFTYTGVQSIAKGSYAYNNTIYASASSSLSDIVYMNGTTDYIGLIGRVTGTGTCSINSSVFSAHYIGA